jgi:hypothetical protein
MDVVVGLIALVCSYIYILRIVVPRLATLRVRFKYRRLKNEIKNPTKSDNPDEGELPRGTFRY